MAASFWVQQLNESWELKATLYSTKAYAQENKLQDPKRKQEFRTWIRTAKQLSEERLKRDRKDEEALYFLGAAEGLEAAFSAAVERKFMASLRSGSDAVERHREALKLNPRLRDAELTIGLYDYIIGSLPLPLKLVVGSLGVRGSKKRGLQTLETVAREGHWARDVALVLLVDLYKREKRWTDAVSVSRALASRYERNYLFKLQLADALAQTKSQTSQAEINEIFKRLIAEKSVDSATIDLIHYRYGETFLQLRDFEKALNQFQWVANHKTTQPEIRAISRLRLAQCLDLMGNRSEAIVAYRSLLDSQFEEDARRGMRERFRF